MMMTECKLWEHAVDGAGYPRKSINGAAVGVHRYVLAQKLGRPIREGYMALHHCDTPRCINEDHLYEGTGSDNMQDCVRRGRWKGKPPSGRCSICDRKNHSKGLCSPHYFKMRRQQSTKDSKIIEQDVSGDCKRCSRMADCDGYCNEHHPGYCEKHQACRVAGGDGVASYCSQCRKEAGQLGGLASHKLRSPK